MTVQGLVSAQIVDSMGRGDNSKADYKLGYYFNVGQLTPIGGIQ